MGKSFTVVFSFPVVVEFGFLLTQVDGDEQDGKIDVSITKSVATATSFSLTVTPTQYNNLFGFSVPTFDPDSPNIATR